MTLDMKSSLIVVSKGLNSMTTKVTILFLLIGILVGSTQFADAYIPVTSILDGSVDVNGTSFDMLGGVTSLDIMIKNNSTYVVTASFLDHGVQIFDISNPNIPFVVASIADGSTDVNGNTYDELNGAYNVVTTTIGLSTYAIVASLFDDGVQIIDISNPSTPLAVASIADGSRDVNDNTFDELWGASDVAITTIGLSTYAIVSSLFDDGVQIIDISNPNTPLAVASMTDGAEFPTLDGAIDVVTTTIGLSTYAIVASHFNNGLQIIDISNPSTPLAVASIADGSRDVNGITYDMLDGARSMVVMTKDSITYLMVTAHFGDGVQIIDISNPNIPLAVASIADDSRDVNGNTFDELDGAVNIIILTNDSFTYAIVASFFDDGVQIIDISNPNIPLAVASMTDNVRGFNTLDGANHVVAVNIDSLIYLVVAGSNDNGIQIIDTLLDTKPFFEIEGEPKRSSCPDCVAPTLGVNSFNKRVVDDGFSYNGNSIQVDRWHTPFPLINATVGEINTVEIIIYENQGVNNMKLVQFGLGGAEIGQPLSEVEVLVEVWLDINSNNFAIDEIIINDKDSLIESSSVVAVIDVVKCSYNSQNETCLKVTLQYSYREPTIYNMMIVNLRDKSGNSQNFYLNEGIQVIGQSMNPVPYVILDNRKTKQQTEDLTLALFREDKVKDIWIDGKGIEYHKINDNWFDRITPTEPYKCTDPPLGAHGDRNNCNFRNLTELWTYEQQE